MQPIIKKSAVRIEDRPRGRRAAAEPEHASKRARLIHVDGRVAGIEVRCDCGEVTVLELDYESTPSSPPSPGPEVLPR
jgi:hypothetical protein